jgi:2-octaprenyl-6-methoxyphenol hydroxylase
MPTADTKKNPAYDIVIVGGGMVGISLALLLNAQKQWNILIIEAQAMSSEDSADKPTLGAYSSSFDARSTALSWSSRNIYQSIGLWPQLKKHLAPIEQIHVSDRGHMGLTRIHAEEAKVEALGYVVENRWLGSVLLSQLEQADIDVLGSASVETIVALADGMQLGIQQTDKNKQMIDAKLVVIADGAGSSTAQKLGIQSESIAYGQTGIIANISIEKPHNGVAYERFTDQGPMALLPLTDFKGRPRSALVWTQPSDIAESLMVADERTFLDQLQARFGHRLGQFQQVGERVSFGLALTKSSEQVRRNLVVMGNAAHSLHPVAGQGFNLSLRDAATLADSLASATESVGDLTLLQSYQQQQAADQRNTVLLSDSLPKLFGLSASAAALGRNSGLLAMDLIPSLRRGFARFGMGMATREAGNKGLGNG